MQGRGAAGPRNWIGQDTTPQHLARTFGAEMWPAVNFRPHCALRSFYFAPNSLGRPFVRTHQDVFGSMKINQYPLFRRRMLGALVEMHTFWRSTSLHARQLFCPPFGPNVSSRGRTQNREINTSFLLLAMGGSNFIDQYPYSLHKVVNGIHPMNVDFWGGR